MNTEELRRHFDAIDVKCAPRETILPFDRRSRPVVPNEATLRALVAATDADLAEGGSGWIERTAVADLGADAAVERLYGLVEAGLLETRPVEDGRQRDWRVTPAGRAAVACASFEHVAGYSADIIVHENKRGHREKDYHARVLWNGEEVAQSGAYNSFDTARSVGKRLLAMYRGYLQQHGARYELDPQFGEASLKARRKRRAELQDAAATLWQMLERLTHSPNDPKTQDDAQALLKRHRTAAEEALSEAIAVMAEPTITR